MNKLNIKKIITFFVLTIIFYPSFSSAAQLLPGNISIKLSTEFPRANQTISATVESYAINIDSVYIRWFKNQELLASGYGQKKVSFISGEIGEVDIITVEVVISENNFTTKSVNIRPAEVDLIWEADSATPPFYKGKALGLAQSNIKVIAFPNLLYSGGAKANPEEIIYTWKKDWVVLGSLSGYGKRSLELKGSDFLRDPIISVEARTKDGKIKAKKNINITSYQPEIVFYKKDSLLGILFNQSVSGDYLLGEEEMSLVAYPFFFSKSDYSRNNLKYNWLMNGKKIEGKEDNNLVLRQEGGGSGKSSISLEIENKNRIMQSVRESFNVIFGEEKSSAFRN